MHELTEKKKKKKRVKHIVKHKKKKKRVIQEAQPINDERVDSQASVSTEEEEEARVEVEHVLKQALHSVVAPQSIKKQKKRLQKKKLQLIKRSRWLKRLLNLMMLKLK